MLEVAKLELMRQYTGRCPYPVYVETGCLVAHIFVKNEGAPKFLHLSLKGGVCGLLFTGKSAERFEYVELALKEGNFFEKIGPFRS